MWDLGKWFLEIKSNCKEEWRAFMMNECQTFTTGRCILGVTKIVGKTSGMDSSHLEKKKRL